MSQSKIKSITIELQNGRHIQFTPEDIEKVKEWQRIREILKELRLLDLEDLL